MTLGGLENTNLKKIVISDFDLWRHISGSHARDLSVFKFKNAHYQSIELDLAMKIKV